jgi:hypothetical protein
MFYIFLIFVYFVRDTDQIQSKYQLFKNHMINVNLEKKL